MNKFLLLVIIFILFPFNSFAKKRDVELEIKALLDGKKPIVVGHILVANLIPKIMRMPDVEVIGVRSTDKDGKLNYNIKNLNGKGILQIKLLSDKCDWYSKSYTIDLNKNKGKVFHIVLNAESESCDR